MQYSNVNVKWVVTTCSLFFAFVAFFYPLSILGQANFYADPERWQAIFAYLDSIDAGDDSCAREISVEAIDMGFVNDSMLVNRVVSYVKRITIGSDSAIDVELYVEWTKRKSNPYRSIAVDEDGNVYRLQGWNCLDLTRLLERVGMHEYVSFRGPADTAGAISIIPLALALKWSYGNQQVYPFEWDNSIGLHDTSIALCYGVVQISPPVVTWRNGFSDYREYDILFSVLFYTIDPYLRTGVEVIAHEVIVTWDGELIHNMIDMSRPCHRF